MKLDTDRAALARMLHLPAAITDVRFVVRAMAPEGVWPLGPTTTQLLVWAPEPVDGAAAWWDALTAAVGAARAPTERTMVAAAADLLVPERAARWPRRGDQVVIAGVEHPASELETVWRYGWVIRVDGGLVMSFLRG